MNLYKLVFNRYTIGGALMLSILFSIYNWMDNKIESYRNETESLRTKYNQLQIKSAQDYDRFVEVIDSLRIIIATTKKDTFINVIDTVYVEKNPLPGFRPLIKSIKNYKDKKIEAKFEMYAKSPVEKLKFSYTLNPSLFINPKLPSSSKIIITQPRYQEFNKKDFGFGFLSGALITTSLILLVGK